MSQPRNAFLLAALLLVACARKPAAADPRVGRGGELYAQLCATCHGRDRGGYASDNAPSLRTTTLLASASDAFLNAGITRGRPGTAMAAFGSALGGPLAPADVEAILAFLRAGGAPPVALPASPGKGNVVAGKLVYTSYCERCHGTPTQRSSAVHLANPILLATASDAFLRYAVAEGRLPTSMVAWSSVLSPQAIDDVVTYVRSLAVPPGTPPAPPVASGMPRHEVPSAVTSASASPARKGPIVINPRGRAPEFTLKDNLYVSIDQVKAALDGKRRLVIADARPPSDWLSLHITGALSTPYYNPKAVDDLPKDGTWIITYCACPHHLSGVVADDLRKRGYPHVAVLDEGIFAWQQKKYPVVAAPGTRPPPAPPPLPAPPARPPLPAPPARPPLPAPPAPRRVPPSAAGPSFQKSKR